jgi:hypothetical protein
MVAENDAEPAPAQQPHQALLSVEEWHVPKVLTADLKQIEGVQHGLADGAAAVQRVKDSDAIRTLRGGSPCAGEGDPESARRSGGR